MKKILLGIMVTTFSFFAFAQNEILDNKAILNMIELGFAENVIITKIKTSKTDFNTSIEELKKLKDKGVDNDIIVVMMKCGEQNKENEVNNQINKAGIYLKESNEFKKIFPTAISNAVSKTLGSTVSPEITNTKIKSVLINEHSNNNAKTNIPEFYFYFNATKKIKADASNWWFSTASSPHEFILVKLENKKGKRELKTGEVDIYSGKFTGVESRDIVICNIETISETEFRVTPQTPLLHGEYCFFYQGVIPNIHNNTQSVFDFSISENYKTENKYKIDSSVWVLKEEKPRKLEVMSVNIKNDGIYYSLRSRNSWKDEEYKESECYSSKDEAIKAN